MNMRVAILLHSFFPKWIGGTEVATYNLADNLVKRGHEVHIITTHDDNLPYSSMEKGFYIHRIAWPKIRIIGYLSFWTKIYLQIQKIYPDIIHCQSLDVCIPAEIAKKTMNIPYVVWGQGSDIYLPGRFLQLASKPIIQNADAVLALTEDMKQKMQRMCDREIFIVPNGVDLEMFEISSGGQKSGNSKTIIFVGRLHPVKGVQYLIEAMTIVHQEMPEIELVIVGDGVERARLEELAKRLNQDSYIQFTGRIPQGSIPRFMHQADIFALSSLSEGLPVVLLEAMAAGLPIIATNVGGIPDIVKEGVNGYLVNVKNPNEIADKILFLLQNYGVWEEISVNNREKAKLFAWDKVTETVEKIYFECSGNVSLETEVSKSHL